MTPDPAQPILDLQAGVWTAAAAVFEGSFATLGIVVLAVLGLGVIGHYVARMA